MRLHRNNAAEWAMVAVLSPVAWAVRLWTRVRRPTRRADNATSFKTVGPGRSGKVPV